VFLIFTKIILLKVVYPLKLYQRTESHGVTLCGESFFIRFRNVNARRLEWLTLRNLKKSVVSGHIQWHDRPTEFHKTSTN
jgi:hypothetical protein